MAEEVAVVVRTVAGNDDDLGSALGLCHRLRCQGCASASEDHGLPARKFNLRALCHELQAVCVGIVSVQAVRFPDDGIHAADCPRLRRKHGALAHDIPLVRDGHVQPANVLFAQKLTERFRRKLDEPVSAVAQLLMDAHGVAVF